MQFFSCYVDLLGINFSCLSCCKGIVLQQGGESAALALWATSPLFCVCVCVALTTGAPPPTT